MRAVVSTGRVVWYAVLSGANDYWAIFTLRSWVFGWCVRMFSQVAFFALIGKLLRSDAQTEFFLVGNAVMISGSAATFAMNMTTAERGNGTLSLLVASPSPPVVVFASRGVYVMADGVFSSLLALFVMGPAFGVSLPFPRVLAVLPLTLLVGLSAYCFSTFLAGVILRRREITGLVVNSTIVALMALCGINVPLSFFPGWLERVARCLPITNGLEAIRDVIDGGDWTTVASHAGAEAAVGAAWLLLALATFGRFLRAGQRDGSLEYAA